MRSVLLLASATEKGVRPLRALAKARTEGPSAIVHLDLLGKLSFNDDTFWSLAPEGHLERLLLDFDDEIAGLGTSRDGDGDGEVVESLAPAIGKSCRCKILLSAPPLVEESYRSDEPACSSFSR